MNLSRKLLAGAMIALLPLGSVLACTNGAWLGTAGANPTIPEDPDAVSTTNNSPDNGEVARYSGQCALRAHANGQSWVGDNSPGGGAGTESIYRARFYVYTGQSGAKVFSATTADNGGGTEVIGITFTGTAFQFTVAGTTVPDVPSIAANQWFSIELLYQASGAFQASVNGGNSSTARVTNSAGNAGASGIGSVRLGQINAGSGTGNILVDEFDSSRSAATAIGVLCRGDADKSGTIGGADRTAVTSEIRGVLQAGQPDCDENGSIGGSDRTCITALIRNFAACPTP